MGVVWGGPTGPTVQDAVCRADILSGQLVSSSSPALVLFPAPASGPHGTLRTNLASPGLC